MLEKNDFKPGMIARLNCNYDNFKNGDIVFVLYYSQYPSTLVKIQDLTRTKTSKLYAKRLDKV